MYMWIWNENEIVRADKNQSENFETSIRGIIRFSYNDLTLVFKYKNGNINDGDSDVGIGVSV